MNESSAKPAKATELAVTAAAIRKPISTAFHAQAWRIRGAAPADAVDLGVQRRG